MKRLYWSPPKAEELQGLGLAPEDFPPPECELWADNWPAIQLFTQVSTQWRVGMNGPTGLDYNVVFHELDRRELERAAYDDLMGSIRVIEHEALRILTGED